MMADGAAETAGAAGVTRRYVCPARDQLFLLPVSMDDWLDQGHLARFVIAVIGSFDTSGLHRRAGVCPGRRPYQPEMMAALLLYAYCCGIRSSRRIEAHCQTDAAFRLICGNEVPDHATIARFVVDHERALEGLFVEGVRVCAAAGLADLSVVAVDGTKIAADASLARNRDGEWIRQEIAKVIAITGADAQSAAADTGALPGVAPVGEITSASGRHAVLRRAQAAIEAQDAADAAERAAEVARQLQTATTAAEQGRKLRGQKPVKDPAAALARAAVELELVQRRADARDAARAAKVQAAAAAGRAMRGPAPSPDTALARAKERYEQAHAAVQAAAATTVTSDQRVNITDPDSRIMSTKDGWVQGYNCQAIVNDRIVLACDITQDAGDVQQFEPMVNERLTRTLTAAGISGQPDLVLADAGYCSEHNLTCPGPDRLIATTKDHKQRLAARELGTTNGPPPPHLTPVEEMEHLLRTPQGTAAYKQRSCLIEHIFGDRKHNRHIRQFRRRGTTAVRSEWAFANLAGNILTLFHHRTTPATA